MTTLVRKRKEDDIDEWIVQIMSFRLRSILEFLNCIKTLIRGYLNILTLSLVIFMEGVPPGAYLEAVELHFSAH